MNQKRMPVSAPPGKWSGFFRRSEEGQDVTARQMSAAEKADLLLDLEDDVTRDSPEGMMIRLARPMKGHDTDEGKRAALLGIISLFDTLSGDETEAAVALYSSYVEAGNPDTGVLDVSGIEKEHLEAVSDIMLAEMDERAAAAGGKCGVQLPFLIAEHAKRICAEREHHGRRVALEALVWDVDDDIAATARRALDIISGRAGYEPNVLVESLPRSSVLALGMGGAIGEGAMFWQGLRDEGVGDKVARDAISALGHTLDNDVEPTLGALMILSEISYAGMRMLEAKITIIEAAKCVEGVSPREPSSTRREG